MDVGAVPRVPEDADPQRLLAPVLGGQGDAGRIAVESHPAQLPVDARVEVFLRVAREHPVGPSGPDRVVDADRVEESMPGHSVHLDASDPLREANAAAVRESRASVEADGIEGE